MRHYLIFLTCILTTLKAAPQYFLNRNDTFHLLEQKLSDGDQNALSALGSYLKDTSLYIEFTTEGRFETTKSQIAKSIFIDHTLFLPKEFNVEDTAENFKKFFSENRSKIHFDTMTYKFLRTPIPKRKTAYRLYACDYHTKYRFFN